MRVLVLDAHDGVRTVVSRILRSAGHDAEAVGDLHAVSQRFEAGDRYDVIVTCIELPDGTAWGELPPLMERFGFKTIALTGYWTAEDLERSRAAGFSAHLMKPPSRDALLAALDRTLPG